ncbi:MAG TPA: LamG-like jellyroll fold domain-containing protein [Bacteroidia bacterium]
MKKIYVSAILALTVNAFAQVPTVSLTAYYPFNGNTLDYAGTRNGVSVGTPQYAIDRWGVANHCYNIIDHTNYINLPTDVWVSGDYSISSWIYVTTVCLYPRIFDFGNGYCINDAVCKMANGGSPTPTMEYYVSSASTGQYLITTTTLNTNTWYHIVYIQQGTTMYIYINNVLASTKTNTIPPENIIRTKNKIGGSNAPLNDDTKAYFDDFRIYSRALTKNEVTQLYNEPQATGINQLVNSNEQISIYPNPASTIINVQISQFDNGKTNSAEVYNIIGECVHHQIIKSSNCQIDVSDLAEGIYNISIINNEGVVNKRLVIVR